MLNSLHRDLPNGLQRVADLLLCCARTRLDPEHSGRINSILSQELDWSLALWLAHSNGMVPLLYHHLRATCPETVPRPVLGQLRAFFHANARANLRWTWELLKLVELLDAGGIRPIAFKGPLLALTAYGNLSLRQFSDLDLLISRDEIGRAGQILMAQGYRPCYQLTGKQQAAVLRFQPAHPLMQTSGDNTVSLDLHWSITARGFAPPIDPERLDDHLQQLCLGGTLVQTPSPEALLLILCVHGAKHRWERLGWICDVAELLRCHQDLDWHWVQKQAAELGTRRMVMLGLFLAVQMLDAPLPSTIRTWIYSDQALPTLAAKVYRWLFRQGDDGESVWQRHLFVFKVRERLWDGLRFALARALSPNMADVRPLHLPPSLAFLYYLLRPVRLLDKFVLGHLRKPGPLSPYELTPTDVVHRMLDLAEVRPQDVVYDLGSGDGRIVITAAKRYGVRGVGLDTDPLCIAESQANSRREGVDHLVSFVRQDATRADLSSATLVTMYLTEAGVLKLRPILKKSLRPEARIVSYRYDMGDWPPTRVDIVQCDEIYLWRIPESDGSSAASKYPEH